MRVILPHHFAGTRGCSLNAISAFNKQNRIKQKAESPNRIPEGTNHEPSSVQSPLLLAHVILPKTDRCFCTDKLSNWPRGRAKGGTQLGHKVPPLK